MSVEDLSLVWSSLRNIVDFEDFHVPCQLALVGTRHGQFPIDSHQPIFLEFPSEGKRQDLSGRFGSVWLDSWQTVFEQKWSPSRTIFLPVYEYVTSVDFTRLRKMYRTLVKQWNKRPIPDNIPCAALAVSHIGDYTDERQAQRCTVLLMWANASANILHLDWFQGPLEDCISPEWYMRWLDVMSWSTAIDTFKTMVMEKTRLINSITSVYVLPTWLGQLLSVRQDRSDSHPEWEYEWVYSDNTQYCKDVTLILRELRQTLCGSGGDPQDLLQS